MWCIVGLGNPGKEYETTRHNVGFQFIDLLSKRWGISVNERNPLFLFGSGNVKGIPILLVKPMTFMNRSGESYGRLLRDPDVQLQETLIVYDDLHLPLGKIRLRQKGGGGGHNGLTSILNTAGSQEIPRLRIGIDGSEQDWIDYVLSPFPEEEWKVIEQSLERSAEALESMLRIGIEKAMNLFNG